MRYWQKAFSVNLFVTAVILYLEAMNPVYGHVSAAAISAVALASTVSLCFSLEDGRDLRILTR